LDKAKRVHKFGGSGNVDAAFMEKIQKLIGVVLPNWSCKEVRYLIILTLLVVLRTQMSIWLADVNGKIVKAIVERSFSKFCYRVSSKYHAYKFGRLDFQHDVVLDPIVRRQLGDGLLHEAALGGLPREDHALLSRPVSAENVLL
jgi:hypothetical protein